MLICTVHNWNNRYNSSILAVYFRAFTEVYHCVNDQLRMESHDCSLDIVLSHFLFLGQQNNGTTALLPPELDIDNCKSKNS